MADRGHADGDQVLSRQVRQDLSVDFVVAERWLVLSKTELLQPTRDIDRHLRSLHQGDPASPARTTTAIGRFNLVWDLR